MSVKVNMGTTAAARALEALQEFNDKMEVIKTQLKTATSDVDAPSDGEVCVCLSEEIAKDAPVPSTPEKSRA